MARVTTSSSPLMAPCLRSCIPTPSLCRRVLNSGGVPSEWESEPLKDIGPGLLRALVLPLLFALIHPSAWNRYSANFATTEFYEVPFSEFSEVGLPELRLLGSSRLPSAFGIMFLLIAQRIDPTSKHAREGGSQ